MNDRFAYDIGDFSKFGLLRALAGSGLRLGVVWYHTTDSGSGGAHTGYLEMSHPAAELYRCCDPKLYEVLGRLLHTLSGVLPGLAVITTAIWIPLSRRAYIIVAQGRHRDTVQAVLRELRVRGVKR